MHIEASEANIMILNLRKMVISSQLFDLQTLVEHNYNSFLFFMGNYSESYILMIKSFLYVH